MWWTYTVNSIGCRFQSLPADPALHPSDLSSGSSSGGGDAALAQQQEAQQQQQQQQLEQPHELSDTDSSEWVLPKNVAGGAGAGAGGGAATGSTQQQQTQQVGTIGQQQQQPGSGGEAGQLYSSATVYAVRFTGGDLHDSMAAAHAAPCGRHCLVRLAPLPAARHLGRCSIYLRSHCIFLIPWLHPRTAQVRNGNGNFTKFYYKFHNVRLTKKAMYFYMPPGALISNVAGPGAGAGAAWLGLAAGCCSAITSRRRRVCWRLAK